MELISEAKAEVMEIVEDLPEDEEMKQMKVISCNFFITGDKILLFCQFTLMKYIRIYQVQI